MARLQSVSEQFRIAKQRTLAETQKIIVATAKSEHAKIMAADPRPVTFKRFVDGREGAPEETVKGDGTILYNYPRIALVAEYALEVLRENSPIGAGDDPHPGAYRDSHTLFFNGKVVGVEEIAAAWKMGDEVAISSLVPYARKIEVGSGHIKVNGGYQVYLKSQKTVAKRYGNMAKIYMTFRPISGGDTALERWASATKIVSGGRHPGSKGYDEWTRRQPTLLIYGR